MQTIPTTFDSFSLWLSGSPTNARFVFRAQTLTTSAHDFYLQLTELGDYEIVLCYAGENTNPIAYQPDFEISSDVLALEKLIFPIQNETTRLRTLYLLFIARYMAHCLMQPAYQVSADDNLQDILLALYDQDFSAASPALWRAFADYPMFFEEIPFDAF